MPDFPVVLDAGTLNETDGFTILAPDGTGGIQVQHFRGEIPGSLSGGFFSHPTNNLVITAFSFTASGKQHVGAVQFIAGQNAFGQPASFPSLVGVFNTGLPPPSPPRGRIANAMDAANDRLSIAPADELEISAIVEGIDEYDITGFSVASAGDINGDGFGDILISAPGADPDGDGATPGPTPAAGVTYVVLGSATPPPAGFSFGDLDGANGFRIDGVAENDYSGWSVAGIGDFNGDGFDDILIGAYRVDGDGVGAYSDYAGASYVVFGSDDPFAASMDLADLDGANGFRIEGLDAGDRMGRTVAGAGDVNVDGIADLIIGAHSADPGGFSNAGETYVVFGSTTPFGAAFDLTDLGGVNGFRVVGAEAGDHSGVSVSSAGDVNGDGFDDLIIGAYGVDVDGPSGFGYQGAAYVVFGSDAPFAADLDLSDLDGSNGFRLRGDAADGYAQAGYSVASAGDVNGDGFDDLLIGAVRADAGPGEYSRGAVFVVFGSAAPFAADFDLTALDGANGFRINGAANGDYAGSTVSSAGDINGDGFDDIAISASGTEEAYVIYGRAPTTAVSRIGSDADQTIRGGDFNDTLNGGKGSDTLAGGKGDDRYIVDRALDSVIEKNGGGEDRVLAKRSYTLADGQKIERLEAKDKEDSAEINLGGNNLANEIVGNAGANRLSGFASDDDLTGLAGDDRLYGGAGADRLKGGAGSDRYYFDASLDPASNVDTIAGFAAADDAIYLDRAAFAAIDAGALAGAAFRAGTAAQDVSDRIIYNSATGKIWYDPDGTGAAAQQLFARVAAGTALSRHDFFGYGTAAAPADAQAVMGEILIWTAPEDGWAPAWLDLDIR